MRQGSRRLLRLFHVEQQRVQRNERRILSARTPGEFVKTPQDGMGSNFSWKLSTNPLLYPAPSWNPLMTMLGCTSSNG